MMLVARLREDRVLGVLTLHTISLQIREVTK